jgi:hypothetical protein
MDRQNEVNGFRAMMEIYVYKEEQKMYLRG